MKLAAWFFMLFPTVWFTLLFLIQDQLVGVMVWFLWLVSTAGCLAWGFFIRPSNRGLAWLCLLAVALNLVLMILPEFMPAKTRTADLPLAAVQNGDPPFTFSPPGPTVGS